MYGRTQASIYFGIHGGPRTNPGSYQGITNFLGYQELYVNFQLCRDQGP